MLEHATSGGLGNNKVFCPTLEECKVLKKTVSTGSEWPPPPPVWFSETCDSGMGRWRLTPQGPYGDGGTTCQLKAVPQQREQGSPWISEQPAALLTAMEGRGRRSWGRRIHVRSSVAWAPSRCSVSDVNQSLFDIALLFTRDQTPQLLQVPLTKLSWMFLSLKQMWFWLFLERNKSERLLVPCQKEQNSKKLRKD